MKAQIAAGLALVGTALAQQSAYGQCGGANWTGATTCVSGYTCAYQNDYYSQCVPGTASAGTTTLTTKPATSTTLSTSIKPTTSSVKTSSSTTSTSSKATTTSSAAASGATGTFATTSGTEFVLNGETGYFAATNSYWISFLNYQADVDLVMSHLASSGIKVLRVWGFNDVNTLPASGTVYFQYLSANGSTINTGVDGLQSLDIVVNSAASHGIALIINFVNNWTDYGGMQAYVNAFGGSQTTWFTNTAAQAQYQKYIKAVVSRYANSSAIFAWELANEPRCTGCDESVIYNWAKTTSAYVKSLDSKHLVTLGDEGFFPSAGDGSYPYSLTAGGYSFADNLNISTLDFGTFHMYPTSWGVDSGQWALDWIAAHGAACVAANKPCFFEEYGYPTNHTIEIPWQQKSLATAGISGDAFWQDGDYLSWGATYDDGYAIYYNSTDWTNLVTNHVAAIDAAN